MPASGIPLTPKSHLMTQDEIYEITKIFVDLGVNKVRLTGGEPLVRKDFNDIINRLATLPIEISITTNGILIDRHIGVLKKAGVHTITVSLDSLDPEKFKHITRRNEFYKVQQNIDLLLQEGFNVKINIVLIKDFNDNEIIDFINLTQKKKITVRFIEFMPFDGNRWDRNKLVPHQEILSLLDYHYPLQLEKLTDEENATAKNYKIKNYEGSFGLISSITNPFCDSCNRIRLTADGKIKNCLFSSQESSLLEPLRNKKPLLPVIQKSIQNKNFTRGGMDTEDKINDPNLHSSNRSMISIGG